MLRALLLVALVCVYCDVLPSVAAQTVSVIRYPTIQISSSDTTTTTDAPVTTDSTDEVTDSSDEERYYHPAEDKHPRVLEEFSHQSVDGSYEYKYILSNGVARYEKSYWKRVGKGKKFLARKGFYSHPLPNHKYMTVFYTADEHGFQQDIAKYTNVFPTLPKHLDVTQLDMSQETSTIATTTTTSTRKPKSTKKTTTRKPKTTTTQRPSTFNWIY